MEAVWVAVGNEILSGRISDTNLGYFCKAFNFKFSEGLLVADDIESLTRAFSYANKFKIAVICGGLGPTSDDLTLEGFLKYSGLNYTTKLEYLNVDQRTDLNPSVIKQATIPEGFKALKNQVGTAPLIFGEFKGTTWFFLPGVPAEFSFFCNNQEFRYEFTKITGLADKTSTSILVFFKPESVVFNLLKDSIHGLTKNIGFYPKFGYVEIVVSASELEILDLIKIIKNRLEEEKFEFLITHEPFENTVFKELASRGLTIACAESITGGLISKTLTQIPGSSKIFKGGAVVYSLKSKEKILGLKNIQNPVSREVAEVMAVNVREIFESDIGLSTTGVAGPGSDDFGNPEGLAYCGVCTKDSIKTFEFKFSGQRDKIINSVAVALLYKLYSIINGQN